MATLREIKDDIKNSYGKSFLNQREACDYIGLKHDAGVKFLSQIPFHRVGKLKLYSAIDLARLIDGKREFSNYGG